jgi:hypothetical protein
MGFRVDAVPNVKVGRAMAMGADYHLFCNVRHKKYSLL